MAITFKTWSYKEVHNVIWFLWENTFGPSTFTIINTGRQCCCNVSAACQKMVHRLWKLLNRQLPWPLHLSAQHIKATYKCSKRTRVEEMILENSHIIIWDLCATLETTVPELFQLHEPAFYCEGTFKLAPRWIKYINMFQDYTEKQLHFCGINELHLTLYRPVIFTT
jgi:hypothetical protein